MNKKGYNLIQVIIIIFITSIISAITTGVIFTSGQVTSSGVAYSELTKDKNIQEFLNVYSELLNEYYEEVDSALLIQNAISGMMNYLGENYTTYLDEKDASSLLQQLNGKYTGIGITIQGNEIIDIIEESPAAKSGLAIGDKIISVNGEDTSQMLNAEIALLIKANKENVILGVTRGEETLTFTMSAEELDMPSVEYNMIEGTTIGHLKISIFATGLDMEVENAISFLRLEGMNKLIVDLRGNTGGYLDQADKVASIFLKNGDVIYSLEEKDGTITVTDETNNYLGIPVVVLVNGGTASASEILAGALKDSYGATIVGTTTYGKGKVQHTLNMDDGGLVKYTSSKWLRPNGECVDEVGITPDHYIENEVVYDETNTIITNIVDKQLEKAIELLNS